jgi:RHS repeat-associated protein
LDVLGVANYQAGVTVNGATQDYRRGEFYQKGLTVTNSSAPVWLNVTSTATYSGASSNVVGGVFVPQTPEGYTYDADGNLTLDGHYAYTWDAENRLVTVTDMVGVPYNVQYLLNFTYDYLGRRIQKIVSTNNGMGSWVAVYTNKFVYDGWNPIAVLDGGNNLLYSFTWGSDLSGSVNGSPRENGTSLTGGAGGVGGLTSETVYGGANAGTYFPCYDGNGNVMALVSAANGVAGASYEYDAFGNLVQETGSLAYTNNILFSSKWFDRETGLSYYGYRFYNPSTGRWLSRDPIEERGGLNVYGFVGGDAIDFFDFFGLASQSKNKNLTQTITVGKCEVVVLIGHGSQTNPHIFQGPADSPDCWAGGFIGCYSATSNGKLGGNLIPGSPMWTDDIANNDPDYIQALKDIQQGAVEAARALCKKSACGCKTVKIIFMYAPSYDTLVDFAKPSLPKNQSIDCSKVQ